MHVYGFAHEDLKAARKAVEGALSISLEQADEEDGSGHYFRWYIPDGPVVQIRSNSGSSLRWGGDPPRAWHPTYGVLVFVHGPARESIVESLRHGVPGLSFLEEKAAM